MDNQGEDDGEDLEELGEQLYNASFDGDAAEVARLLDLNAPVNHRGGGSVDAAHGSCPTRAHRGGYSVGKSRRRS